MRGSDHWIVDGNNVFGARPDGWWRDRADAAARLAAEVDLWQRKMGHQVTLVFDGPGRADLTDLSREGFTIRFAGDAGHAGRDAADHLIVELVAEAFVDPELTVVTSDAGLVARLPPGITIVGAGSFRRQLDA